MSDSPVSLNMTDKFRGAVWSPACFRALPSMTATEQGLYKAGDSLLHRLDPRVKVVSCLLLVVLAFAASEWAELFLLLAFVVMAFWLFPPLQSSILQLSWMLRWLLLFTLLTHLLFSPGRTLWGISWLSLDGLLRGSFVCVQMLMAVAMSALMAVTTTTRNLSRAFGWFVQPLQWLGCRTDEWQKMLLLTLDFIPVVQSEIRVSAESDAAANAESARTTAWSSLVNVDAEAAWPAGPTGRPGRCCCSAYCVEWRGFSAR